MLPPGVIEPFYVVKDLGSALILGLVNAPVQSFGLQDGEETLYGGIIPAVASLAHAAHDTGVYQQQLELFAGVLATLIGVMQNFAWTSPAVQRHHQGVNYQLRGHRGLHGPANDTARIQIHHRCYI